MVTEEVPLLGGGPRARPAHAPPPGRRHGRGGGDAPLETVEDACGRLDPGLVVLHAVTRERVKPVAEAIRTLAREHRVALGGAVISEATRVAS